MSDHKAIAEELSDPGYIEVSTDEEAVISLHLAQVHATLYLAEQQRIGNLIALNALTESVERHTGMHGSRVGLIGHQAALYNYHPTSNTLAGVLRKDVSEGLGL